MEHRCSARIPMNGSVTLSRARHGTIGADLVNIGTGGVYLKTRKPLPANAIVVVDLRPATGAQCSSFRLRAMVVHGDSQGVGLMFEEFEVHAAKVLRALLDQQMVSASDAARRHSIRAA